VFSYTVAVEMLLVSAVILITLLLLWRSLRRRTRRRGSKYYVPTFKANFDTWDSKWTMDRRLHERQAKAYWQREFDRS